MYNSARFHKQNAHTKSTVQKATIHQVTTMLATSKNVLFPGHNHLLTTGTDDPVTSLEIGHLLEVASMVVTWWVVAFLHSEGTRVSVVTV